MSRDGLAGKAEGKQASKLTKKSRPSLLPPDVPWSSIRRDPQASLAKIQEALGPTSDNDNDDDVVDDAGPLDVPVLCKRGNDSKMAVAALEQLVAVADRDEQERATSSRRQLRFVDITGGLTAWSKHVDPGFPMY